MVEPGFSVNHRYFASERIAENKFKGDIPKKEEIIKLLVTQEAYRNRRCYGKEKDANVVSSAIKNLFKIKELIDSVLGESHE